MATTWKYQPILKWKQGERIALRELDGSQWDGLVPVLELPGVAAAPNTADLDAALPAYRDDLVRHISATIPDNQPICIDTRFISPAYSRQVRLAAAMAKTIAKRTERKILPVVTETMVDREATELAAFADFPEVVLRIQSHVVDSSQTPALVDALVTAGVKRGRLHLLIDQYSIVQANPDACYAAVRPYLDAALGCACASVTLAGGSFPINLMGFKQGIVDIPRVEWKVWQLVIADSRYAGVRYSDYTVSNPAPLPEMDPRQVNPSVAIRYTAATYWRLFKAGGFKRGRPNQYRDLCKVLLGDAVYSGPTFSFGDKHYDKVASGPAGQNNGNPSSWRRDATNHHLVFAAAAL